MESRYPKTVEALIERIKMDACPGMGDLSSQCCASLGALENMVEQNRKLRDLVAELEYLDSEAKQGAELAEDEINYLRGNMKKLSAENQHLTNALANIRDTDAEAKTLQGIAGMALDTEYAE